MLGGDHHKQTPSFAFPCLCPQADLEARLADGNDLAVELLATQEALAASEHRAAAAEQQLAAAEHRVMQAEAMAAGVEAMQRRLFDQRDGHVDTALAMAEVGTGMWTTVSLLPEWLPRCDSMDGARC